MNGIGIFVLKVFNKLFYKCGISMSLPVLQRELDPDKASSIIYNLLVSDKPCMVARYGSTELSAIINYLGVANSEHSVWNYVTGKQPEWWWNKSIVEQMQRWSGFFPATEDGVSQFAQMMLEDTKQLDVIACWSNNTVLLDEYIPHYAIRTGLINIEPYWANTPWTRALKGKRVVVVHPFAKLIEKQYNEKRTKLFENPDVLPEFCLRTVQAVQSLGGESNGFKDWFEALDYMKSEIDSQPYDIALIGCGAYGFPLAAHVKRTGHKAVHLAGALQLLFGIRGKRWDDPKYGLKSLGCEGRYINELFNSYWVYPTDDLIPKKSREIEGGCYW